jgi:hypothetical protein
MRAQQLFWIENHLQTVRGFEALLSHDEYHKPTLIYDRRLASVHEIKIWDW